jgi:hypothetical protein
MKYIVVLFLSLITISGSAQIALKPIPKIIKSSTSAARVESHTITLPIWDDFSTSTGLVDTTWWMLESQSQVIVKHGIGIDPPSTGVATFDGVDASGIPYLTAPTDGSVDSLVSHNIDLTQVPINLRNTVYLSFFYQFYGNGEPPEEQDSLMVFFKNVDGDWDKVWPINSSDNYTTDPTVFTEIFTQVSGEKYFHNEFQFMFKAKGRQNGWLDNWLVDYVYMDKRRSATDNSYFDRTFTAPPSSVFDQFTAMPFDDFMASLNKSELVNSTKNKLRNLEAEGINIEYSVNLYDTLNNVLIETTTSNKTENLVKFGLLDISSKAFDASLIDPSADSLFLMLEYLIDKSGDKFLIDSIHNNNIDTVFYDGEDGRKKIDLRQNDATKSYFNLHNYYAYDDGTAEYGAGINQPQGKLAVQFNVVESKYLNRIDIYFPNIQGNQAGVPLELFVLNNLDGDENSVRFQSNIAISHTGINQFITYKLAQPIFVTDTFFIGFTNLSSTNEWLSIGLDKNTDSFDRVYYNVDGNWFPNTEIHGSLMMRPYFTQETPVVGIRDKSSFSLEIYPNPSTGRLKIEGNFNSFKLVDLLGKEVPFELIDRNELAFKINTPQILIFIVETDTGVFSRRIIASPASQ